VDPSESFNVIERSAYYFLSEDAAGFSLWSVFGDDADEPVLVFPSGDDGLVRARAAFRRETWFGRWSRILLIAAIVAAPAWIGALLVQRWFDLFGPETFSRFGEGFPPARLQLWFSVVSSVANAAFIISVGLSVVIWLHRRYRREG
jgi:hypothetical protein